MRVTRPWRADDPAEAFLRATQCAVDLVHNLARRMTGSPADAEDLVQETYLRAWRAWVAGTRPKRVEPWLATVCLNAGRDRARHTARHPELPVADPDPGRDLADVERTALDRVRVGQVEAALALLPEAQRMAVVLADVCGLTAREVAETTGCPLGTALARIHRGRLAVAALLEQGGGARHDLRPGDPGRPIPRR
jgi:RNA polymerase sigma-70 factor (ECF subfamily)